MMASIGTMAINPRLYPKLRSNAEDLLFAIDQFRIQGRDLDVLRIVPHRSQDLPTRLLIDVLTSGLSQIGQGTESLGNMLPYYVDKALVELRSRNDASEQDIAKIEYAYLPLMRYEYQPRTLVALLAKDSALFVEVVSHVFRGKNAPDDEVLTEKAKARARTSYELLSAFKTVPGLKDEGIDVDALHSWVSQARALAVEKGLEDMCDERIGTVPAHAPISPGESHWPPAAICNVIESVAAEHIERGFEIECFNKRGVYSKAFGEGGGQERTLAAKYQAWADLAGQFPRTSAMLSSIAQSWLNSAAREDTRAEQWKLKS
jgi:hypothetical protein